MSDSRRPGVHVDPEWLVALRESIGKRAANDLETGRRGLSLDSAVKAAQSDGSNPLVLYIGSQTISAKARYDSGELTAGGIASALAPVADVVSKSVSSGDLDRDANLAKAVGTLGDVLAWAGSGAATKSAASGEPQASPRDAFGRLVSEPTGIRRGPAGEALGEDRDRADKSVEELLAEDRSDEEDAGDGGMIRMPYMELGKHQNMFRGR